MTNTDALSDMLFDNGFSSPEELAAYRIYDPNRPGCNIRLRFYVFEEGPDYVQHEYEFLDLLMESAYGPEGLSWKLLQQSLITGTEPSLDGKEMRPYYADELTILTPDGIEETFYFDVTSHMLSSEED